MSTQDLGHSLQDVLGRISPSEVIHQGLERIFHDFFSRATHDELDKLLPLSHPPHAIPLQTEPITCDKPASTLSIIPFSPSSIRPHTRRHGIPGRAVIAPDSGHQPIKDRGDRSTHADYEEQTRSTQKIIDCLRKTGGMDYCKIWDSGGPVEFHETNLIGRYASLQNIIWDGDAQKALIRCRQRLCNIMAGHALESIVAQSPEGDDPRKALTHAIDELAETLRRDRTMVKNEITRRRHYVKLFHKIGPGAVLNLGDSRNTLWEREVTNPDMDAFLIYSEKHLEEWIEQCKKLNFTAASLIIEGLFKCGWTLETDPDTAFIRRLCDFVDKDALAEGVITKAKQTNDGKKREFEQLASRGDGPLSKKQRLDTRIPAQLPQGQRVLVDSSANANGDTQHRGNIDPSQDIPGTSWYSSLEANPLQGPDSDTGGLPYCDSLSANFSSILDQDIPNNNPSDRTPDANPVEVSNYATGDFPYYDSLNPNLLDNSSGDQMPSTNPLGALADTFSDYPCYDSLSPNFTGPCDDLLNVNLPATPHYGIGNYPYYDPLNLNLSD